MEGEDKYQHFLAAGSRTTREFEDSWNSLAREAGEICQVLGKEVEGPLAKQVVSTGARVVMAVHGAL